MKRNMLIIKIRMAAALKKNGSEGNVEGNENHDLSRVSAKAHTRQEDRDDLARRWASNMGIPRCCSAWCEQYSKETFFGYVWGQTRTPARGHSIQGLPMLSDQDWNTLDRPEGAPVGISFGDGLLGPA